MVGKTKGKINGNLVLGKVVNLAGLREIGDYKVAGRSPKFFLGLFGLFYRVVNIIVDLKSSTVMSLQVRESYVQVFKAVSIFYCLCGNVLADMNFCKLVGVSIRVVLKSSLERFAICFSVSATIKGGNSIFRPVRLLSVFYESEFRDIDVALSSSEASFSFVFCTVGSKNVLETSL